MDNFNLKKYLAEGKLFEEDFKNPILDKYLELKKSIDYKTVFPTDLQSFLDSLDNTEREGLERDLAEGKLYEEKYLKEDINYDEFDEKPIKKTKKIDVQSMAAPLESALADRGLDDLDDLNSMDDFLSFIKYLEKYVSNEIPSEFFALEPLEQVRVLSQAQMYI